MFFRLRYGMDNLSFELPNRNVLGTVEPHDEEGLPEPEEAIRTALRHPIGTEPLRALVKARQPRRVAVIVNDITRPTPYRLILPPLVAGLREAGVRDEAVRFIIATGIHPAHTEAENRAVFGEEFTAAFPFISHNPDEDLVDLGQLSTGTPLYINRHVVESDFILTTGMIALHYFAGFSGGRKSILPGVAGRETIRRNHEHMLAMQDAVPSVEENPVSLEMIEAARRVGVDFTLNVLTNSRQEIVRVVAGDVVQAWEEGLAPADRMFHGEVPGKAEVAIVSCGGYPRDLNVYQAQKALHNADQVTVDGGLIILLAECGRGLGDAIFAQWMKEAGSPADNVRRIHREFILGGHKAFGISRIAARKEVILISSLDRESTELLFFRKTQSVAEALQYAEARFGTEYRAIVLPHGGLVCPVLHPFIPNPVNDRNREEGECLPHREFIYT